MLFFRRVNYTFFKLGKGQTSVPELQDDAFTLHLVSFTIREIKSVRHMFDAYDEKHGPIWLRDNRLMPYSKVKVGGLLRLSIYWNKLLINKICSAIYNQVIPPLFYKKQPSTYVAYTNSINWHLNFPIFQISNNYLMYHPSQVTDTVPINGNLFFSLTLKLNQIPTKFWFNFNSLNMWEQERRSKFLIFSN